MVAPLALVVSPAAAQDPGPPPAPTSLEVIDLGPNHVTVAWDPVPGVSTYELEELRKPGWRRWRTATVEEPVATIFLDQGTTAAVRVRGYGGGTVWSEWTEPVRFTTDRDSDRPTPVPTDLAVIDDDPVELTVGWQPPTDGPDGLAYRAQVREVGASCCAQFYLVEDPRLQLRLEPDTRYTLRVDARATLGRSGYSDEFEFRTPAEPPVDAPTGLSVDPSPGTVTVRWQPVESAVQIRDYQVRLTHSAGPQTVTTAGTEAEFKVPEGGQVELTVRARDTAGRWSERSAPVTATVPAADGWEELGAPRNLRLVFDDDGIVRRLEWDPATGGADPLTYSFNYRFGSQDNFDVFFTTRQEFLDIRSMIGPFVTCPPGANPGDTFIVRIRAHSQGRESPPSEQVEMCFR